MCICNHSHTHIHTQTHTHTHAQMHTLDVQDQVTGLGSSLWGFCGFFICIFNLFFFLALSPPHTHSLTHTHTHMMYRTKRRICAHCPGVSVGFLCIYNLSHTLSHTHTHTQTHTHMHTHTHTHTHTQIHTHTHTRTHTHLMYRTRRRIWAHRPGVSMGF